MSEAAKSDLQNLEDLITNINNSAKRTDECKPGSGIDEVLETLAKPRDTNADKSSVKGTVDGKAESGIDEVLENLSQTVITTVDKSTEGGHNGTDNHDEDDEYETMNNTIESEGKSDDDDDDEIQKMYDPTDELSFNVSRTDMDFLNDDDVKSDIQPQSVRDGNGAEESEDGRERYASVTDSTSSLDTTDRQIVLFEQKSILHCQLCGELYQSPKLLNCLHTFCLSCLENLKSNKYKGIVCPVCKFHTRIDIADIYSNTTFERLIADLNQQEEVNRYCVVCKIHDEETEVTHICKDCGDVLCEDCAEKHTYSRHTAKHSVVKYGDADELNDAGGMEERHYDQCDKHADEEMKYLCTDCNSSACRDCVMLSHQNHKCVTQTELHTQFCKKLNTKLESLKDFSQKYTDNLEEEYAGDLEFLDEKKRKEEDNLRTIAAEVIEAINDKLAKGLEQLNEEFIKKRSYCDARKAFIEENSKRLNSIVETMELFVSKGNASELLPLEMKIHGHLKRLEDRIRHTFTKLQRLKQMPEIKPVTKNVNLLKDMTYFLLVTDKTIEQENYLQNATRKVSNRKDEKKKQTKTSSKDVKSETPDKRLNAPASKPPSLLALFGQGESLLGEYPGLPVPLPVGKQKQIQTINRQAPSNQGKSGKQMQGHDSNQRVARNVSQSTRTQTSVTHQNLSQQSFINTKIQADKSDCRITGLTFVERMNFAVSDTANNRLKVFALNGEFLDMIQDEAPMSVASCKNALIWNAGYNKIKLYDANTCKYKTVKQYRDENAPHPVTSFKHEKYLVLNRERNVVEAYNMSNQLVHTIKPRNKDNKPLPYIDSIAALAEDQVVFIACRNKKVIVTDFDGNWIGEYSEARWRPGCAAINQHNDIFVTDVANNRLVLLDPRGRFKCDWQLQIDHPYAVACNFGGDLVLSSDGGLVCHYKYKY